MRKSLVLATLIVFACSAAAFAAVPDPTRSGCQDYGKSAACQYKFRSNGTLDKLTLKVTLRDTFDAPVASCSTYCNLVNPRSRTTASSAAATARAVSRTPAAS
jgi:opacity protein-like surface antigen